VDECVEIKDRLPNLQLLEGRLNLEKNATPPTEWFEKAYPDPKQRQAVLDRHDSGASPDSPQEFPGFFQRRRERMRGRLSKLLAR
jgi:hypothetical protein